MGKQAADVEQAAEVEQMYLEIQQVTQRSGGGRRQAMLPAVENSNQQATPQATTAAAATVGSRWHQGIMGHNQVRGRQGSLQVIAGGSGHRPRQQQAASCMTRSAVNRQRQGRTWQEWMLVVAGW